MRAIFMQQKQEILATATAIGLALGGDKDAVSNFLKE